DDDRETSLVDAQAAGGILRDEPADGGVRPSRSGEQPTQRVPVAEIGPAKLSLDDHGTGRPLENGVVDRDRGNSSEDTRWNGPQGETRASHPALDRKDDRRPVTA